MGGTGNLPVPPGYQPGGVVRPSRLRWKNVVQASRLQALQARGLHHKVEGRKSKVEGQRSDAGADARCGE